MQIFAEDWHPCKCWYDGTYVEFLRGKMAEY